MKKIFAPYLFFYVIILVCASYLLAVYPKLELHLLMNQWHNQTGDTIFPIISKFAEWPLFVIGALPLFFWKAGWTYLYAMTEATAAILIFIVKRIISLPRPITCFADRPEVLQLVPGVHVHAHNSFPSGHSSTFFVFFTMLALILAYYYFQKVKYGNRVHYRWIVYFILIALAASGCYSRIYLSQHFMMDIVAGSVIGVTLSCTYFWICYTHDWIKKPWFNLNLVELYRRKKK